MVAIDSLDGRRWAAPSRKEAALGCEETTTGRIVRRVFVRAARRRSAALERPDDHQQPDGHPQRLLLFVLEGHRVGVHEPGLGRQLQRQLEPGLREFRRRQGLEHRIVVPQSRLQRRRLVAERQCLSDSLRVDEKPAHRILRRRQLGQLAAAGRNRPSAPSRSDGGTYSLYRTQRDQRTLHRRHPDLLSVLERPDVEETDREQRRHHVQQPRQRLGGTGAGTWGLITTRSWPPRDSRAAGAPT